MVFDPTALNTAVPTSRRRLLWNFVESRRREAVPRRVAEVAKRPHRTVT